MNHKDIPLNERIIFALDVGSLEKAEEWVIKLGTHINFFKVGLQLSTAVGWLPAVDMIRKHNHKVMCDMKIYDVPETTKLTVRQLKHRGVDFVTVQGNDPILRAAVGEKNGVKVLAVTVLTSFGEEEMREMGSTKSIKDLVLCRARRALELGCDGVISSGLEAPQLRQDLGSNFIVVTPGIRPGENVEIEEDDQKRIVTAKKAIMNGADHIVVGRPISTADDPIAIVETMQREIQKALDNRTIA